MLRSQKLLGWTEQELEEALAQVKQPYYDFELAKVCKWLKENKKTMHVKLNGEVIFKDEL